MKLVAVVQARMGSKRLPGKVMIEIDRHKLLIDWVIQRVAKAKKPHVIVVATTSLVEDDELVNHVQSHYPQVKIFRGSDSNVLSRFIEINELYPSDYVLRVTADCPLVCPRLIDEMFDEISIKQPIYAANCNYERILKGFDLEFIASNSLSVVPYHELRPYDLEHVTPYFYSGKVPIKEVINFKYPEYKHATKLNLSIDTKADLLFFREANRLFNFFDKDFYQIVSNLDEILDLRKG